MIKKIMVGVLITLLVAVLIGCTQTTTIETKTITVCGNEVVESGEQCDNTGCAADQLCNDQCACESIPQPPALPS